MATAAITITITITITSTREREKMLPTPVLKKLGWVIDHRFVFCILKRCVEQRDNVDPCEVCGFVASRKSDMARHAKRHALDDSEYVCVFFFVSWLLLRFNALFFSGYWLGNFLALGKDVISQLSRNRISIHIFEDSTFISIN